MRYLHKTMDRSRLPPLPPRQPSPTDPRKNRLLAALSEGVQSQFFSRLESVPLALQSVVHESGKAMHHVYFPADAVISLQYMLEDGHSTSLAIVGNEGMFDVGVFLGSQKPKSSALVLSGGYAFRLRKDDFKTECDRHDELEDLVRRYTQALISQIEQNVVCNRHHSIDQQLCRCILQCTDRLSHEHLTMTHELISSMIGVRREGVTEAAARLRDTGLISYARGHIAVLDRSRLKEAACECYDVVRAETAQMLEFPPPRRAIRALPVETVTVKPIGGESPG